MKVNVATIQMSFSDKLQSNTEKLVHHIDEAGKNGANIIVLPELHQTHYFCKTQSAHLFALAHPLKDHPQLETLKSAAQRNNAVITFSWFEKDGPHTYNSLVLINDKGEVSDTYRKSHIPDGPGYQEKFYFRPGNTGFKVFNTKYGNIGVAICWDQWFPEVARSLVLQGADIILYPTAIGSEPHEPNLSTTKPWMRVMKGHAVANMVPIAAANRIGTEDGQTFYGHSFVCDEFGQELFLMAQKDEGHALACVDLAKAQSNRQAFGFFRDRRIELYSSLLS